MVLIELPTICGSAESASGWRAHDLASLRRIGNRLGYSCRDSVDRATFSITSDFAVQNRDAFTVRG